MKTQKGFIPLLILLLLAGVLVGSSIGVTKAEAAFPWWDNIVQFFHNHFGIPNPPGTIGGGPSGVGSSTGATSNPACKVASITKSGVGFKYPTIPVLYTKWYSFNTATDFYKNSTCLTCNPPAGAPGTGKYKILASWVLPSQQFIVFVAETTDQHIPFATQPVEHHEEIQNGYWGNLWAMTPDGSKWYQLTHYSSATDGKLYGVLAPIASNNKVVWVKLVSPPSTANPEAVWKLYAADLVVNNGVPSLANIKNINKPNTTLYEPQEFSPDGTKVLISQNTNTPQYGWDTWEYDVATGKAINLTNSPNQWDEHSHFSPDGKTIAWSTSSPYPPPPFNIPYPQYISRYLKTEVWLMNPDGSGKQQLTHFNQAGYPEYAGGRNVITEVPVWSSDGTQILIGDYTGHQAVINFQGACGKQ